MLSFLSGGAKVQVPKRTFDAKYLPNLRKEALENAMRGMFDKLLAHLRDQIDRAEPLRLADRARALAASCVSSPHASA